MKPPPPVFLYRRLLSFRNGSGFPGMTVALLALLLGIAHAAPAPRYAPLEWIESDAITVDGKLSEPAYHKGEWQGNFLQIQNHQPAIQGTRFRLFTNGTHLFFIARVTEASSQTIANITERDGQVWRDDCLELFLQPNSDFAQFFQIIVNAQGAIADFQYGQSGHTKSKNWDSGARAAASINNSGWDVEMVIPLANLGLDPALKEWRFQVARERAPREAEPLAISTWTPVDSRLNDPAAFGRLSLPEFERSLYGWQLSTEAPLVTRAEAGYALRQKVKVLNQTGRYQNIIITSLLLSRGEGRKTLGIGPGRIMEVETEIPLGKQSACEGRLRQEVRLARSPELVYAFTAQEVTAQYIPAQIILQDPGYRATIFESQKLKTISAELEQIDVDLTLENIRAVFHTEAGETKPVSVEASDTPRRWRLTLPEADLLPTGTHQLSVTYIAGDREQSLKRTVTKLPFQEGEVWIDRNGILYRNGIPLPVYGFTFGRWEEIETNRIPGMFMNLAAPIWATPPYEGLAKEVELLARQNIYSMAYVATAVGSGYKPMGRTPLTQEEKENLRALVQAVRKHPSIIGYYLYDEPESNGLYPSRLQEIYNFLRKEDPYRPVGVLNDTLEGTRDYQYGADISLPDPYPLFLRDGASVRPISKIGSFMDEIQTGSESYRARWITPQAFNYGCFNAEGNRGPTAREMRLQQTIALIHGVVGITWYPEYLAWDEPGVYTSLPYLSQEFQALYPLLIAGRPKLIDIGPDWEAAISSHDGKTILMVANHLFTERTVTITDQRLSEVKAWHRWGDANVILPGGSEKIPLTLKAHEAVILVSDNVPQPQSPALDWAAVEKAEADAWAASIVPGNIAHHSAGTKVTGVNTSPSLHLRPAMVQDGMKDFRCSGFEQEKFETGMGLAFDFGRSRAPVRMLVIGSNVASARVERQEASGEWKEIAQLQGLESSNVPTSSRALSSLEARLPSGSTTQLRLIVDRLLSGATTLQIREIEIYE